MLRRKTLEGPQVSRWDREMFPTLFLLLLSFQSLFQHYETNQGKHVRKGAAGGIFYDLVSRVCERHLKPDEPLLRQAPF